MVPNVEFNIFTIHFEPSKRGQPSSYYRTRYTCSQGIIPLYTLLLSFLFSSLPNALITLFQLFTLDQWYKIYNDLTKVSNKAFTCIYILLWVWVGAFIFRNLFVGVMGTKTSSFSHSLLPLPLSFCSFFFRTVPIHFSLSLFLPIPLLSPSVSLPPSIALFLTPCLAFLHLVPSLCYISFFFLKVNNFQSISAAVTRQQDNEDKTIEYARLKEELHNEQVKQDRKLSR